MKKLEKAWLRDKIAANHDFVEQEARRVLSQEMQDERDRLERAHTYQASFDRIWARQKGQTLESTSGFSHEYSAPAEQCIRQDRDLPGEIEWRVARKAGRPVTSHNEQLFAKTLPVFGARQVYPLPETPPILRRKARRVRTSPAGGKQERFSSRDGLEGRRLENSLTPSAIPRVFQCGRVLWLKDAPSVREGSIPIRALFPDRGFNASRPNAHHGSH